jgi:hypothetical protein
MTQEYREVNTYSFHSLSFGEFSLREDDMTVVVTVDLTDNYMEDFFQ